MTGPIMSSKLTIPTESNCPLAGTDQVGGCIARIHTDWTETSRTSQQHCRSNDPCRYRDFRVNPCETAAPVMLGAWLPCLTRARALGEQRFQIAPRVRRLDLRHFLWCPGSDDHAATNSAFGSEIDDPVRGLDDVEVVLDHQHGVPAIDEAVQHFEQQPNILEVQPRRGFVEDVEGTSRIPLRELGRELHALRLASRESGRALTEMDIAQSHVVQRFELLTDARLVLEERQRILHREIQDFADVQGANTDFERLSVIGIPLV